MPIAVRCKCGHTMNVPDSAAGKVGKCPKCQEQIRVPSGNATATAKPVAKAPATQKTPAKAAAAPVANSGLDKLFADAGIGTKKGPTCPSCGASIVPNSVICISCGFHLERGEKLSGHQVAKDEEEFDNMYLSEASRNLARDSEAEERVKFAGSPWWVTLAMVIGLCTIIYAGVSKIQASDTQEFAKPGTIQYAFQTMPWVTLLPFVGVLVSSTVVTMSWIALVINGFKQSAVQGLLVMFVPFYSIYYSIVERLRIGTAANVHLAWWAIYLGFVAWFLGNNGQRFFVIKKSTACLDAIAQWL